jgi:predicted transcriptional regulator
LRIVSNIKTKELAEYLDVSSPFVSMCESGKRDIPKGMRKRWIEGIMVLRSQKLQDMRESLNEIDMEQ